MTKSTLEIWENRLSNPFRRWLKLNSELEQMTQEALSSKPMNMPNGDIAPTVEIDEDKDKYLLKFEIPGIQKDQVKIQLDKNILTVSAERKEDRVAGDASRHYSEFSYGSFSRSFTLPTTIDENRVEASFENGVLSLIVPKTDAQVPIQIAIH